MLSEVYGQCAKGAACCMSMQFATTFASEVSNEYTWNFCAFFTVFQLLLLKAGRFYMRSEEHMAISPGSQGKQESPCGTCCCYCLTCCHGRCRRCCHRRRCRCRRRLWRWWLKHQQQDKLSLQQPQQKRHMQYYFILFYLFYNTDELCRTKMNT